MVVGLITPLVTLPGYTHPHHWFSSLQYSVRSTVDVFRALIIFTFDKVLFFELLEFVLITIINLI